jgi:hypothetical protein
MITSAVAGACNTGKSCTLNWDRERRDDRIVNSAFRTVDYGEYVKFQELEDEVNAGCEKCTIIYNGIQKYRREFEGRNVGGAYIYKTASGISCDINCTLRKGELKTRPVSLLFFIGKCKGISKFPNYNSIYASSSK